MEGKAWVQFRKVDEFIKRDMRKQSSQVKSIVDGEKRKLSGIFSQKSHIEDERLNKNNDDGEHEQHEQHGQHEQHEQH
jgi:hypothetical protein